MELTPSFPLILISLIFIFLVLRLLTKRNTNQKLPPGPWKLPLIGSMHHLISPLPHRRLSDLAKIYGPIMHLQLGEHSNIVISAPETAREVLATHDIAFADRPRLLAAKFTTYNYLNIALAPYGDYWRQLRKICTVELLTAKRVESFRPIREEEVSKLIRSISSSSEAQEPINFSKTVNSLIYSIVSRSAFGKIWEGEDEFVAALEEYLEVVGFNICEMYPSVKILQVISGMSSKLERIFNKFDKILQSILDGHRAKREARGNRLDCDEDLVDVLLNLQDEGNLEFPLRDENIKAVLMDMFGAGTETSSTTIEWTMSELMKNPRTMRKVQEEVRQVFGKKGIVEESLLHELHYLKLVIKEALRLHPPIPLLLPRECRENCYIHGYEIPKTSKVIVNVWAMGRDPNYWKEADKFYPERFMDSSIDYRGTNYEYLPFGAGRRMCPGLTYGMSNVEFPLAQLLYHYDWKLPEETTHESLDMLETFGLVVKRKNDLHLVPISYVS